MAREDTATQRLPGPNYFPDREVVLATHGAAIEIIEAILQGSPGLLPAMGSRRDHARRRGQIVREREARARRHVIAAPIRGRHVDGIAALGDEALAADGRLPADRRRTWARRAAGRPPARRQRRRAPRCRWACPGERERRARRGRRERWRRPARPSLHEALEARRNAMRLPISSTKLDLAAALLDALADHERGREHALSCRLTSVRLLGLALLEEQVGRRDLEGLRDVAQDAHVGTAADRSADVDALLAPQPHDLVLLRLLHLPRTRPRAA